MSGQMVSNIPEQVHKCLYFDLDESVLESCDQSGTWRGRIELPLGDITAFYGENVADKYIRMVARNAVNPQVGGCYIGFDLYICNFHMYKMMHPSPKCGLKNCPDAHLIHSHA